MDFNVKLDQLINGVEGAVSASIMGFDGIPVAEKTSAAQASLSRVDELQIESIKSIRGCMDLSQQFDLGPCETLMIESGMFSLLFQIVTVEYYLIFVLARDAHLGKARYLVKRLAHELKSDL